MTIIVLLLIAVLFSIPAAVAAVTIAMDAGGLRLSLSLVGWALALAGGFFAGILGMLLLGTILDTENFGPEALWLILGGIVAFLAGHGATRAWIRRWLRSLPRRRRRVWRRTLTGRALFGFGAGATAGLVPSVGGGFGGFGGGSFGGGGASGSWSASGAGKAAASASGTASTAASARGAGASGSTGLPATGAAAGATAADGWWDRLQERWRQFRWHHGVAFVLAGLSFAALEAWVVAALEQKMNPSVVALGSLWAFAGFAL